MRHLTCKHSASNVNNVEDLENCYDINENTWKQTSILIIGTLEFKVQNVSDSCGDKSQVFVQQCFICESRTLRENVLLPTNFDESFIVEAKREIIYKD